MDWQHWESGMDWDASYLVMWGTMDFDTEEYYAVFTAMEELKSEYMLALERTELECGEHDDAVEWAEAVLKAYRDFNDAGWSVWERQGEAARLAARVSTQLEVPFAGRFGGESTNTPC